LLASTRKSWPRSSICSTSWRKPERITAIIVAELTAIREQFGDERRSEIILHTQELGIEDFITPQDMVVTLSHGGYIKAQPLADYRAQRRGGRGKQAAAIKDEDFVDHLFMANTHDYILCFSNRGRCYWLKVYEAPQGSRASRGKPIVNLFPLEEGERINAVLPVKEFSDDQFIFMATVMGTVKKDAAFRLLQPAQGRHYCRGPGRGRLSDWCRIDHGQSDIVLVSDAGKAVWFDEEDVRPMGRGARGVRGMKLQPKGRRSFRCWSPRAISRPCWLPPKTVTVNAPFWLISVTPVAARRACVRLPTASATVP
jgi:DNA gyrase subunit A